MKNYTIGNKRLLKLADHLESTNRGLDQFDFSTVCSVGLNTTNHTCGTSGCAMGEMPQLWPKSWSYAIQGKGPAAELVKRLPSTDKQFMRIALQSVNSFKENSTQYDRYGVQRIGQVSGCVVPRKQVMAWFQLDSEDEFEVLFLPDSVSHRVRGLSALEQTAAPSEVAHQLRAFVAHRENDNGDSV